MIETFPDYEYPPNNLEGKSLPSVCIVSGECVGLFRNGGLGTSMTGLAELLAAHGFPVSIIYTGETSGSSEQWKQNYKDAGIELLVLDEWSDDALEVSGPLAACGWTAAYRVYNALQQRKFDIIHFNDTMGEALYCTTAKRLGLAFQDSLLCLALHSPTQWILELNGTPANWIGFTCFSQGERDAVSATDLLWGPSRYLLQWIEDNEFNLPKQVFNQQYVVPSANLFSPGTEKLALKDDEDRVPVKPNELVFFGRLEERKGIRVFCNAIKRIGPQIASAGVKIVLLGKPSTINGKPSMDYISEASKAWPFEWEIISDFDQQKALAYLTSGRRVSVMPSPFDNSPCTVYEALQNRVPFIAARRGGIPELIHEEDKDATLFEYTTEDLADKLLDVVRNGIRPAKPPIPITENRGRWIGMHLDWKKYKDAGQIVRPAAAKAKIDVIVDHASDEGDLEKTLATVRRELGGDVGRIAIILREEKSTTYRDADLLVEDLGYDNPAALHGWLFKASQDSVLCIRSGVTLREGARNTMFKCLGQENWDGLFATGVLTHSNKSTVMPMIASPAFLYLEDKFDTGCVLFRGDSVKRFAALDTLIPAQPWFGLLDSFVTQKAKVWPLAEPVVDLTAEAAKIWRGEEVNRSLRYAQMMRHDQHFAIAIGRRSYQFVHSPHLALSPLTQALQKTKQALREPHMVMSVSRKIGKKVIGLGRRIAKTPRASQ